MDFDIQDIDIEEWKPELSISNCGNSENTNTKTTELQVQKLQHKCHICDIFFRKLGTTLCFFSYEGRIRKRNPFKRRTHQ